MAKRRALRRVRFAGAHKAVARRQRAHYQFLVARPLPPLRRRRLSPIAPIADRRTRTPHLRPAPRHIPSGRPSFLIVPPRGRLSAIGFAAPKTVSICVRRHKRRSVLFARQLTGKGARARRRRRNQYSDVRC